MQRALRQPRRRTRVSSEEGRAELKPAAQLDLTRPHMRMRFNVSPPLFVLETGIRKMAEFRIQNGSYCVHHRGHATVCYSRR